ncbi:MAG: hypothetical protein Q8R11_01470, partial [bacterium]|nr:hypothetical protein [bacterium]
ALVFVLLVLDFYYLSLPYNYSFELPPSYFSHQKTSRSFSITFDCDEEGTRGKKKDLPRSHPSFHEVFPFMALWPAPLGDTD